MRESSKNRPKVPNLRFPGFDTGNNSLYKKELFNDLFTFSTGKNIKQSEASSEFHIPCVRYGELYHMYNEVIYKIVNKTNLSKSDLLFSEGNEILLPSAGEDPLDIGSASALTIKDVAIGRTINILKPKKNKVYSQRYAAYYINQKLKKKISKLAKGSSISNVYNSDLKKLSIILPNLSEQKKIASFLSLIDERIQTQNKIIEDYKLFKKVMMQKLFKQKIKFKDKTGNHYPKWEEKKLGNLSIIKTGSSNRQDSGLNGRYTFFDRSEDIRTSENYLFDCEAIIIAGEGSDFIPKHFIGKFDLHQRTYAIMEYENFINGKFLYYYIHRHRSHFIRQAVGSTVKSLRLPRAC